MGIDCTQEAEFAFHHMNTIQPRRVAAEKTGAASPVLTNKIREEKSNPLVWLRRKSLEYHASEAERNGGHGTYQTKIQNTRP